MDTAKIELFLGTVNTVVDRVTYEILADIPGVAREVRAIPFTRGEMDEPVEGNVIFLLSIDPAYHSIYLYTKSKENDFIGIRSNGKMIDITPDAINIGVYDSSTTSPDDTRPSTDIANIKMDSGGNLNINATGNASINISGNADINVSGKTTLNSPDITITGGKVTMKGTSNLDMMGPFCGIKVCPFTGSPHIGSITSGT